MPFRRTDSTRGRSTMSTPGNSDIERGAASLSRARGPRRPGTESGFDRQPSGRRSSGDGGQALLEHWNELPPPLFILAPPRSFTSVVCAMLGQHPQMYGLPETHLFGYKTLGARAQHAARASFPMADGLLRAVAQLYFGAQNEFTIRKARRWLRLRSSLSTGFIFKALADKAYPRILVEKSPGMANRLEVLNRVHRNFPGARFLHLLRHPRGHGESVMKFMAERAKHGPIPPSHWLLRIATYPSAQADAEGHTGDAVLDPQNAWYALNRNICEFLKTVPRDRQMRVRGEELLADPDEVLPEIAAWLGLRPDAEAVEEMKHPERSPFASLGPPGARYGNDAFFLQAPALRSSRPARHRLDGPLSWRSDGRGFSPEVRRLAQEFGYE